MGREEFCDLSSAGKSAYDAADLGSVPELGRFPGERNDYPLQDSGLENSTDCTVHGVAKSWTRLSDFQFIVILLTVAFLRRTISSTCSLPGMGPGMRYCPVNVE